MPQRAPPGTLQSPFLQPQDLQHLCDKTRLSKMGFMSPVVWCVVQVFRELAVPDSLYYQRGAAGAHEAQLSSAECKFLSYAKSVYFSLT